MKTKLKSIAFAMAFSLATTTAGAVSITVEDAGRKIVKLENAEAGTKIIAVDFTEDTDLDLTTDGVQNFETLSETEKEEVIKQHTVHIKQITQNGDYKFSLPNYAMYTIFVKMGREDKK